MIRVVAICVSRRGDSVLVTEGVDPVTGERFARPLGGGVEEGETSADAVAREVREEVAAEVVGLRLIGVLENLFTYEGRDRHEIVFVYEAGFADATLYDRAGDPAFGGRLGFAGGVAAAGLVRAGLPARARGAGSAARRGPLSRGAMAPYSTTGAVCGRHAASKSPMAAA